MAWPQHCKMTCSFCACAPRQECNTWQKLTTASSQDRQSHPGKINCLAAPSTAMQTGCVVVLPKHFSHIVWVCSRHCWAAFLDVGHDCWNYRAWGCSCDWHDRHIHNTRCLHFGGTMPNNQIYWHYTSWALGWRQGVFCSWLQSVLSRELRQVAEVASGITVYSYGSGYHEFSQQPESIDIGCSTYTLIRSISNTVMLRMASLPNKTMILRLKIYFKKLCAFSNNCNTSRSAIDNNKTNWRTNDAGTLQLTSKAQDAPMNACLQCGAHEYYFAIAMWLQCLTIRIQHQPIKDWTHWQCALLPRSHSKWHAIDWK